VRTAAEGYKQLAAGKQPHSAIDLAGPALYQARVNDAARDAASPYRPPEAPLEPPVAPGGISDVAMRLLLSTKWGMRLAAIALMVNGLGAIAGVVYLMSTAGVENMIAKIALIIIVLIGLLLFVPGMRLMQSSLELGRADESRAESDILKALTRHEEFWKWLGVVFILVAALAFYSMIFGMR
jgi:hypothetical protein